jgi:hypothetical protein
MKNIITENSFISVADELIVGDLLDGEVVILNMKDNTYYGLDQIGGQIWNLIHNRTTFGDIIEVLINEYDVDYQKCYKDVHTLLEDMFRKGLIQIDNGESN